MDGKRRTILVMDPDPVVLKVAAAFVELFGFNPAVCCDSNAALTLYQRFLSEGVPCHAAILGLGVPEGAGAINCAQKILEIDQNACLILSTGDFNSQYVTNYKAHGFRAVLLKPYSFSQLPLVLEIAGLSIGQKCGED